MFLSIFIYYNNGVGIYIRFVNTWLRINYLTTTKYFKDNTTQLYSHLIIIFYTLTYVLTRINQILFCIKNLCPINKTALANSLQPSNDMKWRFYIVHITTDVKLDLKPDAEFWPTQVPKRRMKSDFASCWEAWRGVNWRMWRWGS